MKGICVYHAPKHLYDVTVIGKGEFPGFDVGWVSRKPMGRNEILWIEDFLAADIGKYIKRTYDDWCEVYGWHNVSCYISVIYSEYLASPKTGYQSPVAVVIANADGCMVQTDPEVLKRVPYYIPKDYMKLKVVKYDE